jgi:putative transposase
MSHYRRWRKPGGTFFFTLVSYQRRPIWAIPSVRPLLRGAMKDVNARMPFTTVAIVLLPDHIHTVWKLPEGDADYSTRWRLIKTQFTQDYLAAGHEEGVLSQARRDHGDRGVWQRRSVEHWIRDETDLRRHVDYIHFNPVKHGHVRRAAEWEFSTFHNYVDRGEYEPDWGEAEPETIRGWKPTLEV